MNLRGLGDAARAFLLPTMLFIIGIFAVIVIGLIHPLDRHGPLPGHSLLSTHAVEVVSVLLVLKAFSAGCSALTGVEAIANGVPLFKEPRVERAKRTELLLGTILGAMLLGLAWLAKIWHIGPRSGQTVLSQITQTALGRHWAYFAVSLSVTVVLALAANTSFGGLPVLSSLLARDNYLPASVPAARRPPDFRLRDLVARPHVGRAPRRGGREHRPSDPAVRDRGVHRLHPRPVRTRRALAAHPARCVATAIGAERPRRVDDRCGDGDLPRDEVHLRGIRRRDRRAGVHILVHADQEVLRRGWTEPRPRGHPADAARTALARHRADRVCEQARRARHERRAEHRRRGHRRHGRRQRRRERHRRFDARGVGQVESRNAAACIWRRTSLRSFSRFST